MTLTLLNYAQYYKMKRQKKTNNIFNQPILPESLFHQQITKQYKIGGIPIQGTWLKDSTPQVYNGSVSSALEISEMRNQFNQIKKNSQLSPADMFRMAEIKKKMDNFQFLLQSPKKKKLIQNFNVEAQNLILHKLHNMWGEFLRKCKISGKLLIYSSQKQKKQTQINIQPYSIQFQQKGKTKKETQAFVWPEKVEYKSRLYLFGEKLRPLCVYGDQKVLKNLIKKIKINSFKASQTDFFRKLSKLYQQKIYVLFGNRLRVYEHLLKQKQKDDLNFAYQLLQKSHLLEQIQDNLSQDNNNKKKYGNEQIQSQSSSKLNKSKDKDSNKSVITKSITSPVLGSPMRTISNENSSQFKMRARRSNINYDELEDEEEPSDYKIQDFTLQIKEAAYSDDEAQNADPQDHPSQQNKLNNSTQLAKKRMQSKRFEQYKIVQYIHEDSMSQSSSIVSHDKNNKKSKVKIENQQQKLYSKFQLVPVKYTHEIYIGYFCDFCSYSQPDLQFTFFQKVKPDLQYQNMKVPVCALQRVKLIRNSQNQQMFRSQSPIIIKVSKQATDIGIFLNSHPKEGVQYLQINLKKVLYTLDQSQLIYIKVDNRIHCAGKLKIIASPYKINPQQHQQQTTQQFLQNYLIKQIYKKEQKYKFIDYKKRDHQIHQKWNDKIIKRIVNKGDQLQFQKAVFFGFPKLILQKIEQQFKNFRTLTRAETKIQSPSTFFSHHSFSMMEGQIVKLKCYDLRVYITIEKLISLVVQTNKNQYLQKRIQDICTYCNLKYGKSSIQKFLAIFVIQTLRKTQNLLLQLKNAKQIQIFIEEYFQVEFQIDQIMKAISVYFN